MKFCILFLLFLIHACANNHEIFTIKPSRSRTKIISNNLKINGAYYQINNRIFFNYKNEYINTTYSLNLFILYNNGLAITTAVSIASDQLYSNKDSLNSYINEMIRTSSNKKKASFNNLEYGGYSISGTTIAIQTIKIYHWGSFFVANNIGEIVNDSTIHISRYQLLPDKENRTSKNVDQYYHFVSIDKLDSVIYNRWAKKQWYWKME